MTATRGVNPATHLGTCLTTCRKKQDVTMDLELSFLNHLHNTKWTWDLELGMSWFSLSHDHWKRKQWIEQGVNYTYWKDRWSGRTRLALKYPMIAVAIEMKVINYTKGFLYIQKSYERLRQSTVPNDSTYSKIKSIHYAYFHSIIILWNNFLGSTLPTVERISL